jgi:hypothetical protein
MTGPYRTADVRNLAERVCPWCSARIVVDLDAMAAVCDSCGAQYATALARPRELAVLAAAPRPGRRAALLVFRAIMYVAVGVALPFAAVFGVMVLVGAFTILSFVGWLRESSAMAARRSNGSSLSNFFVEVFGNADDDSGV